MKRRGQPDIRERFGSALRAVREERGLTQEQLAHQAGIHRTYLSDVERGARNISLVILDKLARALELSLAELFARVSDS
ncbi:MAG: helix-turn-helix transcriptional regulator [Gemmataceae bacterium]